MTDYTALVLAGAVALMGACSTLICQLLRRIFPVEGNTARLASMAIAGLLSLIAATQVGLTQIMALPTEQRTLAWIALAGATWWVSQELYRRLRADTWPTKAAPGGN